VDACDLANGGDSAGGGALDETADDVDEVIMPKKTEYIIVSKRGMPPFARTSTVRNARKLRREAMQLGLSGEIVRYILTASKGVKL